MSLPTKFTVLSQDWEIIYDQDKLTLEARDDDTIGWTSSVDRRIYIKPGMLPDITEEVVIHEIIHVLSWNFLDTQLTEGQVKQVTGGLRHIFRTNPQLKELL